MSTASPSARMNNNGISKALPATPIPMDRPPSRRCREGPTSFINSPKHQSPCYAATSANSLQCECRPKSYWDKSHESGVFAHDPTSCYHSALFERDVWHYLILVRNSFFVSGPREGTPTKKPPANLASLAESRLIASSRPSAPCPAAPASMQDT